MTQAQRKEIRQIIKDFKAKGAIEKDILDAALDCYREYELTLEELRNILEVMGYELTLAFETMSDEQKHSFAIYRETMRSKIETSEEQLRYDKIDDACEEMKANGANDEILIRYIYRKYQAHLLTTEQLREMVGIMGYEFTEEFEKMSEEDKHKYGIK